MEIQNQLIERRIYSLALQHKICKEHIEDVSCPISSNKAATFVGIKLKELINEYLQMLMCCPLVSR